METLWQDARYAVRTLSKAPGFTLIVVISIALGIGANATVFSIANGILWSALPVRDPGRLVTFAEGNSISYPDFVDYRDQTTGIFEGGVCAHFPLIPASLGGKGEPERVWGQAVSGNYFSVAGANLALGRGILPAEDVVGNHDAVVVLGHGLWQRRFGSDPAMVGHTIVLNGQRYTVAGVASTGFCGTDHGINAEFWVPLAMAESIMPDLVSIPGDEKSSLSTARDNSWLILNARLKAGVSHAQALAAVNVVKRRLDETYRKGEKQHSPPMTLDPASGMLGGSESPAASLLAVLMVVVGLVLLVACANVANLMLARATGRQREVAIRLALGASRARLVRQLLTESILLSLAGAALGFMLAATSAHAISRFELPLPFPIVFDLDVDARVFAFTAVLSIMTGLLFGLVPALRATRPNLVAELKNESTIFGRIRGFGLRNSLVVVQVALSLVLLAGAGLFLRSLQNASSIDLGMKPENILLMGFDPKLHSYSREQTQQFLITLRERVSALPGVRSISFVDSLPLSIGGTGYNFKAAGLNGGPEQEVSADVYSVGSGFFETMGIPLLRGREFNHQGDDERVVIVNETMAQHLFGTENPLGREIVADRISRTVVGVARNAKSRTLGEGPRNCAYLFLEATPEKVFSFYGISITVKTAVNPRSLILPVRAQITALDSNLAVFRVETMQEHVGKSMLLPQISATLLGVFGAVGLTLAAIGLYGVMSYSVRRRTREIGIRMAVGASSRCVLAMVMRQGMIMTGVGLAIGLALALALGRFTASLLYGISGTDRLTLASVTGILLLAGLAASLFPAHRAARVEPVKALRYE